jgi:hypothetical protein
MREIQFLNWKDFKEVCIEKKKLNIQYQITLVSKDYHVFAVEGNIYWYINLIAPKDIRDFKKNYMEKANYRIDGSSNV